MNIDFQALRQALTGGGAPATQGMERFNVSQNLAPPPQAPQQPQGLQQKLANAQGPWQKFNAYAGDPNIQNAVAGLAKILQAKGRFAGPRGTDAAMQTALQMPIGAQANAAVQPQQPMRQPVTQPTGQPQQAAPSRVKSMPQMPGTGANPLDPNQAAGSNNAGMPAAQQIPAMLASPEGPVGMPAGGAPQALAGMPQTVHSMNDSGVPYMPFGQGANSPESRIGAGLMGIAGGPELVDKLAGTRQAQERALMANQLGHRQAATGERNAAVNERQATVQERQATVQEGDQSLRRRGQPSEINLREAQAGEAKERTTALNLKNRQEQMLAHLTPAKRAEFDAGVKALEKTSETLAEGNAKQALENAQIEVVVKAIGGQKLPPELEAMTPYKGRTIAEIYRIEPKHVAELLKEAGLIKRTKIAAEASITAAKEGNPYKDKEQELKQAKVLQDEKAQIEKTTYDPTLIPPNYGPIMQMSGKVPRSEEQKRRVAEIDRHLAAMSGDYIGAPQPQIPEIDPKLEEELRRRGVKQPGASRGF